MAAVPAPLAVAMMPAGARMCLEILPRAPFRAYLERRERWACLVVHRRGGKTFCCIQDLIHRAFSHERPGPPLRYAYVAPTRNQAKDIAWGYLKQFCATVPGVKVNEADLTITLPHAASIRLYSGDNYERMRGLYFDGVVIDEMGDIDPQAWHAVIRPCLTDYRGWATFIGTPKGRNEFWRLHRHALEDAEWYSLVLRASESGLIPEGEIRDVRKATPEPIYRQEYECDFSIGRPGAIYARDLERAREQRRVGDGVLWFKEVPCYTAFDVGAPRNQKLWVFQLVGDRINFLEALSGSEECKTPADWAARLRTRPYSYGAHFLPHDACAEQGGLWQDGLEKAGLSHIVAVPRQGSVWDGINLAVDAFPRTHFHSAACADGLEALDAYHSREERDGVTIRDVPVHDWSSHYSDAFSLAHQAIGLGLVLDRSAVARKPRVRRMGSGVVAGFRGV